MSKFQELHGQWTVIQYLQRVIDKKFKIDIAAKNNLLKQIMEKLNYFMLEINKLKNVTIWSHSPSLLPLYQSTVASHSNYTIDVYPRLNRFADT